MSLTQKLARNSLPSTTKSPSGHDIIIAGYALTFIIGASFHFALVLPNISGSVAILLTTLWFARSSKQLVALAFTIVGGSIVVGPAAALAVILIWREARVQD